VKVCRIQEVCKSGHMFACRIQEVCKSGHMFAPGRLQATSRAPGAATRTSWSCMGTESYSRPVAPTAVWPTASTASGNLTSTTLTRARSREARSRPGCQPSTPGSPLPAHTPTRPTALSTLLQVSWWCWERRAPSVVMSATFLVFVSKKMTRNACINVKN